MTTYTVQGPSGRTFTIDGPEGATADQLGQVILSQHPAEADAAAFKASANPTADMSTGQRLLAGIGQGMASVGRGVSQLMTAGPVLHLPGDPEHLTTLAATPATIDAAKASDAPLLATTAGKVGGAIGKGAAVAPVALVTAPTLLGATTAGALTGAATTEGGIADRAVGAAGGAVGGAAGYGAGRAIGAGVSAAKTAIANTAASNTSRQAAVDAAQSAGYVLPPNEIAPTSLNSTLQAWAGPVKTTQAAAAANQATTNDLAAAAVGLPKGVPITADALGAVRKGAGQAYDAVATTGTVTPTPAYDAALDKIVAPFKTAAAGFPNAKPNPVIANIEALRSPGFDAGAAVAKVGELRGMADTAFAQGDKQLGGAYKSAAGALEDQLDQHLVATGAPADALQAFRDARTTIAKTYDIQRALKGDNVSAPALAAIAQRSPGRLTNQLADIAATAQRFPKAMAVPRETPSPYSAVDAFGGMTSLGTAAAVHNPLTAIPALGIAARPMVRSAVLSPAGQALAGMRPGQATTNALLRALQTPALPPALTVGGIAAGSNLLAAYAP